MPAMTNAQTGKTNFAGNWAFNQSKSDMGQPPQGGGQGGGMRMGGNFSVKQEANLLTVERTRTGQDGTTTTTTENYTLDGKESVNTNPRGESKSTVTWSADGKTLTIVTTRTMSMNGESMQMKSTSIWSLTDANTLTVNTTSTTPNGDRVTKMVYDKK
jgi:dipeptidyl aminopeptidase/acylaminoacyl peptidase